MAEWIQEENMEKNSGRIVESYEGIVKKMKEEFFIDRIC